MTRTISLPFHTAKTAATAVLPHVSDDDVTPALTHAVIRERHLIGTDRYSVADYDLAFPEKPKPGRNMDAAQQKRYDAQLDDWERRAEVRYSQNEDAPDWDEPFYIPRAALARISTLNERQSTVPRDMLSYSRVTITEALHEPGVRPVHTVSVALHDGDLEVFRQVFLRGSFGNYPPVWKLLDDWKPQTEGEVTFGLMPTNLQKVFKAIPKHEAFTVTAGEPQRDPQGKPTRLAPMMVETSSKAFRALIQPALILR
ncbi:hypothetical protein SEA_DELAGARZA_57 [Microbacterium phage DelaGarza]|nr:hypothetical protein SEA_DELAGARZA_57 [Microbacterium phage DelaGarza]